jgi:hypothetical protein
MFERIKKAFSRSGTEEARETVGPPSQMAAGAISEWASTRGFGFSTTASSGTLGLEGKVRGKRWRMELGRPTRSFILGEELRGRAELGIEEDAAVLVLNRTLKEALEKKAFEMYTDPVQTIADRNLPEEMRWLAMYDEVGWDGLPAAFWTRYAVLADRRENAVAWIDPGLAARMLRLAGARADGRNAFHADAAARQGLSAARVPAGQHRDAAARVPDLYQRLRIGAGRPAETAQSGLMPAAFTTGP